MVRRLPILIGLAVLCSCGRVAPLRPAQGEPFPVKPLMARSTPSSEDLLRPPAYANPERADELIKRSQPRPADRFDLPPAGAGGTTSSPPGGGEDASTNQAGPVTPE